jgi:hypothetical protein
MGRSSSIELELYAGAQKREFSPSPVLVLRGYKGLFVK